MKKKKILLLLLITYSTVAVGQSINWDGTLQRYDSNSVIYTWSATPLTGWVTPSAVGDFKSTYDTVVLHQGNSNCQHKYVEERKPFIIYGMGCLMLHGPEGCPENWFKGKSICTICLKHIDVRETRTVITPVDEYQLALKRLNELLKKE